MHLISNNYSVSKHLLSHPPSWALGSRIRLGGAYILLGGDVKEICKQVSSFQAVLRAEQKTRRDKGRGRPPQEGSFKLRTPTCTEKAKESFSIPAHWEKEMSPEEGMGLQTPPGEREQGFWSLHVANCTVRSKVAFLVTQSSGHLGLLFFLFNRLYFRFIVNRVGSTKSSHMPRGLTYTVVPLYPQFSFT